MGRSKVCARIYMVLEGHFEKKKTERELELI
jgi:hypothetical protein